MSRRTKTSAADTAVAVRIATEATLTVASLPAAADATAAVPIAPEAVKTEPVVYAAWIGLDWADEKHDWSLCTADGKRRQGQMKSTPEAIELWAADLWHRSSPDVRW
jgi:hypothetical protein